MSAFRLALSESVGESMVHIMEPIAAQTLHYIVEKLGYTDLMKDQIELVSDFRTTSKSKDSNGNALIQRDRVRAKLNPSVNPFNNKWEGNGTTIDLGNGNHIITNNSGGRVRANSTTKSASYPDQQFAIFVDGNNFIDLTELAVGSTLTMDVQMDFKDIVVANECLSRIYQCFVNGDMTGVIDIQYDYPVPMGIQKTLRYLYGLCGKRSPTDYCWKWIQDGSQHAITALVNRNRPEHKEAVVNKNQLQAVYQIDCSMDAPTMNPEHDAAVLNFTVTVQYARANRMLLRYPVTVNNQYVDTDYVPMDPELRSTKTGISPIMFENPAVTKTWERIYQKNQFPLHYPWWDGWQLPASSHIAHYGFKPVCSVVFTLDHLDTDAEGTVIDLIDGLPGFRLSEQIIRELQVQRQTCLTATTYVNVSVFADDNELGCVAFKDSYKPLVEMTDGKHLICRATDPHRVYRLVVSVNEKPVNLTARPITTQLYPSKWFNIHDVTYSQTKDGVVLEGVDYFYYDTIQSEYIQISPEVATVGKSMSKVREETGAGVIYTQQASIAQSSLCAHYETVPQSSELSTTINESVIGTAYEPVYCYKPDTSKDARDIIDTAQVIADIRLSNPQAKTINLSMIRKQLSIPISTNIEIETAPDLTEPVNSSTTSKQYYQDSYKGHNINRVSIVTFRTGKPAKDEVSARLAVFDPNKKKGK